nr:hypothetical protein CFP56_56196 [Quercus suber]
MKHFPSDGFRKICCTFLSWYNNFDSLPDKCLSGQITGMAKWSLAPYSLHRVQTIATQHLHLIYKPLARSSWKTHFFPSTNDMASTA